MTLSKKPFSSVPRKISPMNNLTEAVPLQTGKVMSCTPQPVDRYNLPILTVRDHLKSGVAGGEVSKVLAGAKGAGAW